MLEQKRQELTDIVEIAKQLDPFSLLLIKNSADILLVRDLMERKNALAGQPRKPPKQTA